MILLAILSALLLTPYPACCPTYQPTIAATKAVSAIATGYCLAGRKTATDKVVYNGCVALSDKLKKQLNAKYGDRITIDGFGTFTFDDRSPQAFSHIDIHFPKYIDAKRFGKRKCLVWKIKKEDAT